MRASPFLSAPCFTERCRLINRPFFSQAGRTGLRLLLHGLEVHGGVDRTGVGFTSREKVPPNLSSHPTPLCLPGPGRSCCVGASHPPRPKPYICWTQGQRQGLGTLRMGDPADCMCPPACLGLAAQITTRVCAHTCIDTVGQCTLLHTPTAAPCVHGHHTMGPHSHLHPCTLTHRRLRGEALSQEKALGSRK